MPLGLEVYTRSWTLLIPILRKWFYTQTIRAAKIYLCGSYIACWKIKNNIEIIILIPEEDSWIDWCRTPKACSAKRVLVSRYREFWRVFVSTCSNGTCLCRSFQSSRYLTKIRNCSIVNCKFTIQLVRNLCLEPAVLERESSNVVAYLEMFVKQLSTPLMILCKYFKTSHLIRNLQ